jgi:ABC-type dipeptide/oligopeptide/nickel transport system permease subunit
MLAGRLEDVRLPHSVIIDELAIKRLSLDPKTPLKVGDSFEINDQEARVVGICDAMTSFTGGPYVWTTYNRSLQYSPPQRKMLSAVIAAPRPGISNEAAAIEIEQQTGLRAYVNGPYGSSPRDFNSSTVMWYVKNTGIPISFGTTVLIGFIVGVAISCQTFYSFVLENMKHLGALKAMGASTFMLCKMLLLQAFTVGVIGYGVGLAATSGFAFGALFGFVAGYFQNSWVDKAASMLAVLGVSVPHYWLGMVMVIVFAVLLPWLPPSGAGPGSSADWVWNWEHLQYLVLPALTMSVIPMGIVARTVRALVADILAQEFIVGLRAKGLTDLGIFLHVVKNAAPTALAVMGLQLGYLLGGSILIETVFSWPGAGFLLNSAIFQRDLPLLQGTILVLAMFFVLLNLIVDVVQSLLDPRIARS